MGPTNQALLKLFEVDSTLRDARERLEQATKDIRIQQIKINDANEKLKVATQTFRKTQSNAAMLEIEIKSRDTKIEHFRVQQQQARNDKEYKAFIAQINTTKADRDKLEEHAVKTLDAVARLTTEVAALTEHATKEQAKLEEMQQALSGKVSALTAEIQQIEPVRAAAAAVIPSKALQLFERLSSHFDGPVMAPIVRIDPRLEEYHCSNCNMELIVDVYNRLKAKDDVVQCTSCLRILYVPLDMAPVEKTAPKAARVAKPAGEKLRRTVKPGAISAPSAPATREELIKSLLTKAQGESVVAARDADQRPVECLVTIDGTPIGEYKGKSPENLEQVIKFVFDEAKLGASILVLKKSESSASPDAPATPEQLAASASS
jgi:predicted  nucleic acid-binding Zn-ribbon protein